MAIISPSSKTFRLVDGALALAMLEQDVSQANLSCEL